MFSHDFLGRCSQSVRQNFTSSKLANISCLSRQDFLHLFFGTTTSSCCPTKKRFLGGNNLRPIGELCNRKIGALFRKTYLCTAFLAKINDRNLTNLSLCYFMSCKLAFKFLRLFTGTS